MLGPALIQAHRASKNPDRGYLWLGRVSRRMLAWATAAVLFGVPGTSSAEDLSSAWEQAWQDYDRHYSYFNLKGVDWDAVYYEHQHDFMDVTPAEFAVRLNAILQVLRDWHVAVKKPDGGWIGYEGSYTMNFPTALFTEYTGGVPFVNVRNAGVLIHGTVLGSIAYLIVPTFETARFAAISDADIEAVFETYANHRAMILDIRANAGGNENNAARIVSRFTDAARLYGYTRSRIPGDDHDAFTDLAAKTLTPSTGTRFLKPVVGLIGSRVMSSGEWCALMMRACPNVTLMGDKTRGATANPRTFNLSSINVSYQVSSWIGYDPDRKPVEGVGIFPDILIPPGPSSFDMAARRDYVLEAAIEHLLPRELTVHYQPTTGPLVVSWLGVPWREYRLWGASDLLANAWAAVPGFAALRPDPSGLMVYTNRALATAGFYRFESAVAPWP